MTETQRNARGEVSLRRILEATVGLLGRYGYANTTISRITRETGRPASSIYWHFSTKDELIAAALEANYRPGIVPRAQWEPYDSAAPLAPQVQSVLARDLVTAETESPLRLGLMLALEGGAADSRIQEPFRRRRSNAAQALIDWWQPVLTDPAYSTSGANAEQMGTLVLLVLDSHYLSDRACGSAAAATRAALLARGLAAIAEGRVPLMLEGPRDGAPPGLRAPAPAPIDANVAKILHAARTLVAEHGYEGATMGKICAAAGLPKSSVYWRFKDKEALIEAAVADPFVALFHQLAEIQAPPSSRMEPTDRYGMAERWAERIRQQVLVVLLDGQQQPELVRSGLMLKAQPLGPGSAVMVDGSLLDEERLALWLESALDECGVPTDAASDLAWLVWRITEGALLGAELESPTNPVKIADLAAALVRATLEGR